jgi:type IV pilus assembly protein PilB
LLEVAGVTPEMVAKANFLRGVGCEHCHGHGFRGRLGIFELMLMSARIREMTFNGTPTDQIRRAAIGEGMKTLYWDGIDKVCRGVTTLEEVMRVSKRSDND